MVRVSMCTLAWAAAAVASLAWAEIDVGNEAASNTTSDAFIVECNTHQDIEPLVDAIQQLEGQVSRRFESDIFYGFTARLKKSTAGARARVENMQGVKNVWPVEVLSVGEEAGETSKQPDAQPVAQPRRRRGLGRRDGDVAGRWHHALTQVDKLHAEGFLGNGIKIAVVDTGIDYTHPALGGCVKPGDGCRVTTGENLSKDGDKTDITDCNGHGTAVAGVLAGDDQERSFRGVAPKATLAAYRVFGCSGTGEDDAMIAGWLKAREDGASIIVSSVGLRGSGWASGAVGTVVSRIVAKGVPCIVALGNDHGRGLFYGTDPSTGHGVVAVNSFAHQRNNGNGSQTAGMSRASTYGPNWDLDIKPNIGAPGDAIPCPKANGGYEECTGTSFAAPQVAGVVALMAERRGSFDPVLLNSLLMATAEPQEDGGLMPVAQQGGGLVRAWDAAYATTVVEPASLAFNDSEHRPTISLRVTNTAESELVYQLSDVPARTLYACLARSVDKRCLIPEYLPLHFPDPRVVQAPATIKLSKSSITVGPGQSATVDISAEDPKGLDQDRLPVWSGWIAVNGSDGKSLSIPYLGLAGSLHEQPVLGQTSISMRISFSEYTYRELEDGALDLGMALTIETLTGTPLTRTEIVPASPLKWLTERLGDVKSFPVPGFPKGRVGRITTRTVWWNSRLESGDYLPVGEYKFVMRALRIFGDPKVESDWDVAETPTFTITDPAGDKACKIYQGGNSGLPEGSLFQSIEECVQAHRAGATATATSNTTMPEDAP